MGFVGDVAEQVVDELAGVIVFGAATVVFHQRHKLLQMLAVGGGKRGVGGRGECGFV